MKLFDIGENTFLDDIETLVETISRSDYVAIVKGGNTALLPANMVADMCNILRRGLAACRLAEAITKKEKEKRNLPEALL